MRDLDHKKTESQELKILDSGDGEGRVFKILWKKKHSKIFLNL